MPSLFKINIRADEKCSSCHEQNEHNYICPLYLERVKFCPVISASVASGIHGDREVFSALER